MKNIKVFICVVLISVSLKAQEFTYFNQTFEGDTISMLSASGKPLFHEEYFISGHYRKADLSRAIYLRTINKHGKTIMFNDLVIGNGNAIGNIFLGTQVTMLPNTNELLLSINPIKENGFAKIKLLKLNKNQEIEWEQEHNNYYAQTTRQIISAINNGYISAGAVSILVDTINSVSETSFYVLKTDENGKKEWDKNYRFGIESIAYTIQTTPDDGYIIGGYSFREDRSYDMQVAKIDTLGNLLWSKRYGGIEGDCGAYIQCLTTKEEYENGKLIEYLLTGCTEVEIFTQNRYIAVLDDRGEIIWERKYYPIEENGVEYTQYALQTLPFIKKDKGFIGSTYRQRWVGSYRVIIPLIVDFDAEGNINWIKELKPDTLDFGKREVQLYIRDMQPTLDGGYILTGFQHTPQPQKSWVVKIDSLGNTCFPANCDSTIILTDIPEFEQNNIRFSIVPNPVREQATIHYQLPFGKEGVLSIYNLQGVLVDNKILDNLYSSLTLEVENWVSGIYFYSLEVDGRRVGGGKFVVE